MPSKENSRNSVTQFKVYKLLLFSSEKQGVMKAPLIVPIQFKRFRESRGS